VFILSVSCLTPYPTFVWGHPRLFVAGSYGGCNNWTLFFLVDILKHIVAALFYMFLYILSKIWFLNINTDFITLFWFLYILDNINQNTVGFCKCACTYVCKLNKQDDATICILHFLIINNESLHAFIFFYYN
jgi:hypothetical protein